MNSLSIKESETYAGFYEINEYPDYVVNKNGIVIFKPNGKIIKSFIPKGKDTYFICIGISVNKKLSQNLSRIMAKVFLDLPTECNGNSYLAMVKFKDGNPANINLENLEWVTRSSYQQNAWDVKDKINYNKFHLSKDSNFGFYPNQIKCWYYKDCFQFPSKNDFIAINKNGNVYRFPNNEPVAIYIDATGYPAFSYKGEINRTPMLLHRALAMLFVPIPERHKGKTFDELEVNHIDGVKSNFSLSNLEWVTSQENIDHAHAIGLIESKRPVLARNVMTNDILKYDSISACRKTHDLDKHILRTHLVSNSAGKIIHNGFVFKFDNNLDWPSLLATPSRTLDLWKTVDVIAENVITKQKYLFNTMLDAAEYFNISKSEFSNHRYRKGIDVPLKNFIFYKIEDTI